MTATSTESVGYVSKRRDDRQTLDQAVYLAKSGKSESLSRAASHLDGLPVGGWPKTEEAMQRTIDDLPWAFDRSYTCRQFVEALYTIEHADDRSSGIYRRRV